MLQAYQAGSVTQEEQDTVNTWLAQAPENRLVYEGLVKTNKTKPELPGWTQSIDVDAHWQKLAVRIDASEKLKSRQVYLQKRTIRRRMAIAASLVLVGLAGLLTWYSLGEQTIQVTAGLQTKEVTLPDGSKLLLNKNTQLEYGEDFGKKHRSLTMNGQAYFEVAPNKKLPFKIHSEHALTTVVGTSFDLKDYAQSKEPVTLSVTHGLVSFSVPETTGKEWLVKKGEQIRLDTQKRQIAHSKSFNSETLLWSGHLYFDNTKMKEVLGALAAKYSKNIRLENKALEDCLFSGKFFEEELEEVLEVLSKTLSISWKYTNGEYILSGKCQ
ncbi:FecR domain-containing protein [Rapidithrix thailandica]|uniref:FecR domain-containing protein n=1 Tax=Rapidithrix thailandica TaxID=413964 RepID=A0AAW9SFH8_9BACT